MMRLVFLHCKASLLDIKTLTVLAICQILISMNYLNVTSVTYKDHCPIHVGTVEGSCFTDYSNHSQMPGGPCISISSCLPLTAGISLYRQEGSTTRVLDGMPSRHPPKIVGAPIPFDKVRQSSNFVLSLVQ